MTNKRPHRILAPSLPLPERTPAFDPHCTQCVRITEFLHAAKQKYPDYYCLPVAPFGVDDPALLIVGLAPGLHGANATGRPFTGDYAGVLLYETLYELGFSTQSSSTHRDDGLRLLRCRITNAVKCVPPENKPTPDEIRRCNVYLRAELAALRADTVILALGAIAHESVLKAFDLRRRDFIFGHGSKHTLPNGQTLLDSYHCSRYNTQTRRLTTDMFRDVVRTAQQLLRPT